jgi:hypothetical protein
MPQPNANRCRLIQVSLGASHVGRDLLSFRRDSSGQLKFTGGHCQEPAGCPVALRIEATVLTVTADWMSDTTTYAAFVPKAGLALEFATVAITRNETHSQSVHRVATVYRAQQAFSRPRSVARLLNLMACHHRTYGRYARGLAIHGKPISAVEKTTSYSCI